MLTAAGIPLSLIAVLIEERLWAVGLTFTGAVILLTALDAFLALPANGLKFQLQVPDVLFIGNGDRIGIDLSETRWPNETTLHLVCDFAPNVRSAARQPVMVPTGSDVRVSIPVEPERRGEVALQRIWFRWQGPFGLVWKISVQDCPTTIPVIPNIRAVRNAAIQYVARDAFIGIRVREQLGGGSEFDSLREYVPGLDTRYIDWKRSAHHRKLVCKEFQAERNHNVILAFDTGHLMSEPLDDVPRLDHAINAGLLLSYLSLRTGDRVGMYGFDARVRLYLEPQGGLHSLNRLLHSSSSLDYWSEETNFTLGLAELNVRLRRRSLVVLFTEFVDTITAELMVENVERLANRHLLIFLTLKEQSLHQIVDKPPTTFADVARSVVANDFVRERSIVLEKMRRLGVHCLDVPSQRLAVDLLNRYLMIKRRELI